MPEAQTITQPEHVLLITLDSCRFDTFRRAHTPYLSDVGPLHRAQSPSYFTYGSHAAIWMGFTPGVSHSRQPWLNPKAGKLMRMANAGFAGHDADGIQLSGPNVIEGFRRLGYRTIGSGAVGWFDPATETGAVLSKPFDAFFYPGDTWSLRRQLAWIDQELKALPKTTPTFVFLNVGETHVPYWHEEAAWPREPSPCVPFQGAHNSRRHCRQRQRDCLEWVDRELGSLLELFSDHTVVVCADHGDCWGEDGLWEHGISHWATLTVPLLMRTRGEPVKAQTS